jgi:DNA (cytosine-5)-methyltransferase 1
MGNASLTIGSLFSGIGGLDLGLERAGMQVAWQVENDPYCAKVLARHWPHVPNLGDVTTINWAEVPRVDLIAGGYPCQPFSEAGKRGGSDDQRHLWPYMFDAVRVLRPRLVLGENVTGHLSLGFDRVLADLASIGFDAQWSVVSACSMGASHMRRRLFWLAHPAGEGLPGWDAGPQGFPAAPRRLEPERLGSSALRPPDGVEPGVVGGAHGIPTRVDRVQALGNAVVPQVAEHIGRLIVGAEGTADSKTAMHLQASGHSDGISSTMAPRGTADL